jgi:hypothetical protein
MSKIILWLGFVLSIIFLFFGLFMAAELKPLTFIIWLIIFVGSGYKLFFGQSRKQNVL